VAVDWRTVPKLIEVTARATPEFGVSGNGVAPSFSIHRRAMPAPTSGLF
jgi:hypothetical protein